MPRHFPYIPGTQAQTLVQENVDGGGNDRLLAGLYEVADVRGAGPGVGRGGQRGLGREDGRRPLTS